MNTLQKQDPQIYNLIKAEEKRQKEVLEMIPSENFASSAVIEAVGSVLMNKYSEGYPGARYYQGNQVADQVEMLAIERAKKLFGVAHVNVQPYSGSPANAVIYMATLKPGDKIMGLSLSYGGHLTHGFAGTFSGTIFKGIQYEFGKKGILDYDELEKLAVKEKPQIIVASTTAYPRTIDFAKFGKIADKVGAYLLADISHITGLILAGVHPNPVPYAHIIMTTTHKTLRGPRGAMIMVTNKGVKKDPELPKKIDRWIIPGMQGGPHDNTTAAIAVALKEATTASFKKTQVQTVKNAKALAKELLHFNFDLVTGGTDNHLLLIDLRNKKVNGRIAAFALETAGIIGNKNSVPNDTMPPLYASGFRLGTPAITTRGMKEKEMKKIASWMNRVVDQVEGMLLPADDKEKRKILMKEYREKIKINKEIRKIAKEVKELCAKYPVPGIK
jgi:glycine hydroxymethyltransferase